jgi:hypothetical protein
MPKKRTAKQLQRAVNRICKVIGQIPCFYIYENYVARRFATNAAEIALKAMIHNAAMDSSLVNLRCFNEFFRPNSKLDDVRAHHFSGLSMRPFLTSEEERAINKYLAHLTTSGSEIATKPWLLDDMTVRGLQHGIQFLSFIEAQFSLNSDMDRIEVRGVRDAARLIVTKIAKPDDKQVP